MAVRIPKKADTRINCLVQFVYVPCVDLNAPSYLIGNIQLTIY